MASWSWSKETLSTQTKGLLHIHQQRATTRKIWTPDPLPLLARVLHMPYRQCVPILYLHTTVASFSEGGGANFSEPEPSRMHKMFRMQNFMVALNLLSKTQLVGQSAESLWIRTCPRVNVNPRAKMAMAETLKVYLWPAHAVHAHAPSRSHNVIPSANNNNSICYSCLRPRVNATNNHFQTYNKIAGKKRFEPCPVKMPETRLQTVFAKTVSKLSAQDPLQSLYL